MSCHNIGRGLNTVTKELIDLYDGGKISKSATQSLLCKIQNGVNYCDGNEYEAIMYLINNSICSECLNQKDGLYNFDSVEDSIYRKFTCYEDYISPYLCKECIEKLFLSKIDDKVVVDELLKDLSVMKLC